MAKKSLHGGFTLTELMVTITILGIVVALGAPSFANMIKNNQLKFTASSVQTLLTFSRAEAMRTGETIRLITNVPKRYYRTRTLETPATIIRQISIPSGVTISTNVRRLEFDNRGFITSRTPSSGTREFTFCDGRTGETGRKLFVLESGISILKEHSCI